MAKDETTHRDIRTFGRRDGRPLSARQKGLMEALFPHVEVPEGEGLSSEDLFAETRPLWLEIGFGGGEHLIRTAKQNPEIGLIGAEPFTDGVAKALVGIEDENLGNVRLFRDDVRLALPRFQSHLFERVFILFPDPWPKRRQQKRRLIQPAFLDELARVMASNAKLRFATDVASYADEALAHFMDHNAFHWTAERASDWNTEPQDHEPTRYQLKQLGDCAPIWLEFVRV